jgi:EAL domain-containing protein (putative c-di-GMP-specific phosphodiesterase class I)
VVNMTARQLRSEGLAEQVRAALEASRLPPEALLV